MRDLAGQRFGRLTALSPIRKSYQGTVWLCRCDCGAQKDFIITRLTSGSTRSCGCLRRETTRALRTTHGQSMNYEGIYRTWQMMKDRCTNPKSKSYKDYGARGIAVCDRWLKSFADFSSDMGPRPEVHTLERIDNDGPYSPGNCKWATRAQQNRNKRPRSKLNPRSAAGRFISTSEQESP